MKTLYECISCGSLGFGDVNHQHFNCKRPDSGYTEVDENGSYGAFKIDACENLDELLHVLKTEDLDGVDFSSLPVFSKKQLDATCGVWSWDDERKIVGTCSNDYKIVLISGGAK